MKQIPLTQGKFALVDNEDYEELNKYKWHYAKGYAVRTVHFRKLDGTRSTRLVSMHREVNHTPEGLYTDHINHNKLDNQKSNLRVCTIAQNQMNSRKRKNTSSRFKGVLKDKRKNRQRIPWRATIKHDGKTLYLGSYHTEELAAATYNKKAKELFGEFAHFSIISY